jgi:hypothetical protein
LSVVVWAEIPDVIENKKVYSQVTTDKEKKLMKVLYPKNNKTNNVKKLLLLLLALTMLSLADHRDTPNLRKRTRDSLMPKV